MPLTEKEQEKFEQMVRQAVKFVKAEHKKAKHLVRPSGNCRKSCLYQKLLQLLSTDQPLPDIQGAVELLKKLEWSVPTTATAPRDYFVYRCPICKQWQRNNKHEKDCELKAILDKLQPDTCQTCGGSEKVPGKTYCGGCQQEYPCPSDCPAGTYTSKIPCPVCQKGEENEKVS